MRLVARAEVRAEEIDAGLLRAAGLECEPVVVLEPTENGLTVRKLTAVEKIERSERNGESAFFGSEQELAEAFATLGDRADNVPVPQRDSDAIEMHAPSGTRPLSAEEFERHFGHLPADGEG